MRRIISVLLGATLSCLCRGSIVDIDACVVADPHSNEPVLSETSISNTLNDVNRIFRQVAMKFRLRSCIYTNDSELCVIDSTNVDQVVSLGMILDACGGLNVYFVPKIANSELGFANEFYVVAKQGSNAGVLAHEIGHACGLSDIYDHHVDTSLEVEGPSRKDRMPYDWGRYRNGNNHSSVIRNLLMYGYHTADSIDISYGDVYGLWYTKDDVLGADRATNVWHLSNAPVGFHFHGNRHPRSE